jgi:hypothetical protein
MAGAIDQRGPRRREAAGPGSAQLDEPPATSHRLRPLQANAPARDGRGLCD